MINPLNSWWSYQLCLEVVFQYLNQGNEVVWYNAAGKSKKLFRLNDNNSINSIIFKNPVNIINRLLDSANIDHFNPTFKKKRMQIPFHNIADLKSFEIAGSPIGKIIFSSMAYELKTTGFSLNQIRSKLKYYINYLSELQNNIEKDLAKIKPNMVVTIQDRLAASSLALAIARKFGIKTKVYYWGSDINKIVEYENSLYDFNEWRKKIIYKYLTLSPSFEEKQIILDKIENFSLNPSQDSKTFLSYQKPGFSLQNQNKKLITFYASSEHEHSPITLRDANVFQSQYDAFNALQEICLKYDFQLVLKYHPIRHQEYRRSWKKNKYLYDWKKIKINDAVIELMPDSPIDTYKLIDDSDINITWNSTVGLESIARKKSTVIVGDAAWLNLNWNIHAWDPLNLEKILVDELQSPDHEFLIPWFWYLENYGNPIEFVTLENYNPRINGVKILQPRAFAWIIYKTIINFYNKKQRLK